MPYYDGNGKKIGETTKEADEYIEKLEKYKLLDRINQLENKIAFLESKLMK